MTFAPPQLPDRATFRSLAAGDVTVPVWRELVADMETPVSAYRKLAAGAAHAVLLESVEGGESAAHVSIIAAHPRAIARYEGDTATCVSAPSGVEETLASADPLDLLRRECARTVVTPPGMQVPKLAGGAIGFIGSECIHQWEDTLVRPADHGLDLPDAVLMLFDSAIVFDHLTHRVIAVTNMHIEPGTTDDAIDRAYDDATLTLDALVATLAEPSHGSIADVSGLRRSGGVTAPDSCTMSPEEYCAAVATAKEHIAAGDVIQVVLSQRWTRPTDATPFDVYRALRVVNPSPYMFLMQMDDMALVGASPELLVQVGGGRVATHPIAGTRPRGATAEEDEALERALLADEKERAEHVMLVDLGRNDVGRVAVPGSVVVDDLMRVERFSHVMHITSHVSGVLAPDATPLDAVAACFPAGTVSGAPKLRALELIAELEPVARGPYAGAVGGVTYDGSVDLAITIRTLVMQDGVATVQAGAGIVADSDPEREYDETRSKARAMLRAIDVAETFGGTR